jgi:hypothetical protein
MSRPHAKSVVGKRIAFDCLLPTGLLISVTVGADARFDDVKRELWTLAKEMPLFAVLKVRRCNLFNFRNLRNMVFGM